ncbi:MAG: hypothetical protein F6K41_43990 [Symploca sp. SIO3E6]|nr:hypothetical protein [Caldora sp. SIO3E6]
MVQKHRYWRAQALRPNQNEYYPNVAGIDMSHARERFQAWASQKSPKKWHILAQKPGIDLGNPWLNSEYEKKKHVGERGSLPSSTCPKNLCSKGYELFTYYLLLSRNTLKANG